MNMTNIYDIITEENLHFIINTINDNFLNSIFIHYSQLDLCNEELIHPFRILFRIS